MIFFTLVYTSNTHQDKRWQNRFHSHFQVHYFLCLWTYAHDSILLKWNLLRLLLSKVLVYLNTQTKTRHFPLLFGSERKIFARDDVCNDVIFFLSITHKAQPFLCLWKLCTETWIKIWQKGNLSRRDIYQNVAFLTLFLMVYLSSLNIGLQVQRLARFY